MTEPTFFRSAAEWRKWLAGNHQRRESEKIIGFHKAGSGNTGITYKQALDERFAWRPYRQSMPARRRADMAHPFHAAPTNEHLRSQINIKRIEELKAEGRLHPAGHAAYESRDPRRQNRYSFENRDVAFTPEQEREFRANAKAWDYFSAMPPSYRRPTRRGGWSAPSARRHARVGSPR